MKHLLSKSIVLLFLGVAVLTYWNIAESDPLEKKTNWESAVSKFDLHSEREKGINDMLKYQFERIKDPKTNRIPNDIRRKELEFAKSLPSVKFSYLSKGGNSLTAASWKSEGPTNQGGRTKAIVPDIANENILLAAAAEGGVWRSTDDGANWTSVTDPSSIQNVADIEQDIRPGKTNTWYYGTGEYSSNLFIAGNGLGRFLGNGIFKSTDNGLTWFPLESTQENNPSMFVHPFQIVWNIELDESNASEDEIWAACVGGVYGSTDGGATWPKFIKGAGQLFEIPHYTSVSVAADGGIYAALSTGLKSGIYYSADGSNWTTISPSFWPAQVNRIVIATAKSNKNILYVLANTPGVGNAGAADEGSDGYLSLWKYDASNGQWTDLSSNLPDFTAPVSGFTSQYGYDLFIDVKPDDENFVVIGGTNIYRSTDGFSTKVNSSDWIGGYAVDNNVSDFANHHPDQHGLFFLYSNPNVVYSAHDGGVSKSMDITAQNIVWKYLNNGYVTSQFWSVAIDKATANSNLIIGGLQDNGSYLDTLANSASNWMVLGGGDGTYAAISDGSEYFYMSSQNGNVFRLNISKNEWAMVTPSAGSAFLFVTPYMLDPNNTNVMYLLAGDRVWRNSDVTQIPPFDQTPTTVNWSTFNGLVDGFSATALAMSKAAPNLLYVGDNNGNVYKISDASDMSSPFVKISDSNFPKGYISSIAVNPEDGNNALVGFSNYRVQSLFATFDGGNSWDAVGGNLEQNADGSGDGPSIRNVKILPFNGATVYLAATSIGLFTTTALDGMNTVWELQSPDEIGNVVVETMDIRPIDGTVVVGTFGKGVYSSKNLVTSVNNSEVQPDKFSLAQNYPNPFNPSTAIKFTIPESGNVRLDVYNTLGQKVASILNEQKNAGTYTVNFDASSLSSGIYLYMLTAGERTSSKKMIYLK